MAASTHRTVSGSPPIFAERSSVSPVTLAVRSSPQPKASPISLPSVTALAQNSGHCHGGGDPSGRWYLPELMARAAKYSWKDRCADCIDMQQAEKREPILPHALANLRDRRALLIPQCLDRTFQGRKDHALKTRCER
jgi:hypothetical protein